jgi:hypothetical protein
MLKKGGRSLLSKLTRGMRIKTALALVALYAVCILAPHAAMALSASPAHCLTDASLSAHVHTASAPAHTHGDAGHHHDGAQAPHDHADAGTPHQHDDGKSHPSTSCCGVFCVSAIGCEPQAIAAPAPVVSVSTPALDEALAGRGPGRINRPPIA